MANSHYQPSWWNQIILLYSPPTQHHSFVRNLPLYPEYLHLAEDCSCIHPIAGSKVAGFTRIQYFFFADFAIFLVKHSKLRIETWLKNANAQSTRWNGSLYTEDRMADGGYNEKNADGKMWKSKGGWQNVNDNIGTKENKFTVFSYILSCKMRPREFIDRNIFYNGFDRNEIRKKETRKDFDRGTVVIQTPSFTTSKDYGHLLLCKLPLPKTTIFKISETQTKTYIMKVI